MLLRKYGGSIWALVWAINIMLKLHNSQWAISFSCVVFLGRTAGSNSGLVFCFVWYLQKINNNKLYLLLAPKLLDDELVFHKLYAILNLTGKEWNYPEATWCSAIFKQAEVAEDEWQIKPWCYVGYWCAGISRFVYVFSVLDGFVVLLTRMSKVDTFGLADNSMWFCMYFLKNFFPRKWMRRDMRTCKEWK